MRSKVACRPKDKPMKYVAIIALIVAAVVCSQLLFEFYDWNQKQSCASSGGRNCGGGATPINR